MFKMCCEICNECWYVGNDRTCTCPKESTWVGLTDEELRQIWYDDAPVEGGTYIDKLRQVETKLKAKNETTQN